MSSTTVQTHERPNAGLWHVLQTRSRQEKALADDLSAEGVEHFLPLYRQAKRWGRRRVTVDVPLFPGYVFMRGTRVGAFEAGRRAGARRLARVIDVADQERITWELANLRSALQAGVTLDPYPYLKKGMRAEVRSGPMRGLQGLVKDRTCRDRLILQVDLLGQAVGVEIDGALLEPMGEPSTGGSDRRSANPVAGGS